MSDPRHNPLPPLVDAPSEPCRVHPLRAGAWLCVACGRTHCDECRNRTERRLTPVGTCLQCGARLAAVRSSRDEEGWPGFVAVWRQAYSPLGVLSAGALTLPILYGSAVVSVLVPAVCLAVACTGLYFLAVVRWRLTGHADLPVPSRVLGDVRASMAVPGTALATVLAFSPALLVDGYLDGSKLWIPLALLGWAWLPVPLLTGAASSRPFAPVLPLEAVRAVAGDVFGYGLLALAVNAQLMVLAAMGWFLVRWLVYVPFGLWLTCLAVLPGLWAVASQIGQWGRAHLPPSAIEP